MYFFTPTPIKRSMSFLLSVPMTSTVVNYSIIIVTHVIMFRTVSIIRWLGRRISDQGVPGSNPGRCTFRCGLEQVTFTLLSTG